MDSDPPDTPGFDSNAEISLIGAPIGCAALARIGSRYARESAASEGGESIRDGVLLALDQRCVRRAESHAVASRLLR